MIEMTCNVCNAVMEVVDSTFCNIGIELAVQCPDCLIVSEDSAETIKDYESTIEDMQHDLDSKESEIEELKDFIEGYISTNDE